MTAESNQESWTDTILTTLKKRPLVKIIGGSLLFGSGVVVGVASSTMLWNAPLYQRDLLAFEHAKAHAKASVKNHTREAGLALEKKWDEWRQAHPDRAVSMQEWMENRLAGHNTAQIHIHNAYLGMHEHDEPKELKYAPEGSAPEGMDAEIHG